MSLLLEALKKAEKAKEEAQQRARGESAAASGELSLEGEARPAGGDGKHVMTRDELPDISQPLEIVSDDIGRKPAAAPEQTPAATPASGSPQAAPREARVAERAAARKVFEAKFKEPNPRLPFYIALGVLGAFALGTVGYFWVQLRPPAPLVNANPPAPGGEKPVAVAQSQPVAAVPPAAAPAAEPPIPGLPSGTAAAVPGAAATPAPAAPAATSAPSAPPAARGESAAPSPKPAPRLASAPAKPGPATDVSVTRQPLQVHPKVESAYAAYLAGNLAAARADYEAVLREDPANRDALLGQAAIDVRSGRLEAAEASYLRLLRSDPRDAHAQAGLIALRAGRMDPLSAESRVKSLIATDPEAHVLYFTLGNQYAQQGRWAEAQRQYFRAFSAEPENADFAFNLAVSLDHLQQPKLALEYYRRALALAEKRGGSFDAAAARERSAQLAR